MDITVQVRHLESGRVFGFTTRRVQQHRGWKSITYAGQRYQIFGGIRDYEYIDLCRPILSRKAIAESRQALRMASPSYDTWLQSKGL
jgi:hypothetical protein